MRKAAVIMTGTIFNKSHMLLAYLDGIAIIGRGLREVTASFSSITKQSPEVALVINEDNNTLCVTTIEDSTRLGSCLNTHKFEVVDDFACLDFTVINNNDVMRVLIASRCSYSAKQSI